jgi:hypothetical protein
MLPFPCRLLLLGPNRAAVRWLHLWYALDHGMYDTPVPQYNASTSLVPILDTVDGIAC